MKVAPIAIDWRPELSIYASPQFLQCVGDEYGWLGGFSQSREVRCVLPYTIVKKAIFRMVRFRIETIALNGNMEIGEEKAFLNEAMSYFSSLGADMVIPAATNTIFRTYPDGASAAPYGSYVVDLTQSEDTLWSNLHAKHRNVIRNAMKRGVSVRSGREHTGAAYKVIQTTLKRSSLSFMPLGRFEQLIDRLGDDVRVVVAEHEGKPQGCAVVPFSLFGAYYLYAGSAPQPLTGAMNLLVWKTMLMLRAMNVQRFDFVGARIDPERGSKQDGLRMFKERFGGALNRGYIWKCSFNRLKYLAYCGAVRIWRGGDIVDLERHKLESSPNQENAEVLTKV